MSQTTERDEEGLLDEKIIFTLTAFPVLTPTMLQVGIGPHIPPRSWRPVLEKLIAEGKVLREEKGVTTPIGQYRTLTVLKLAEPTSLEVLMEGYRQASTVAYTTTAK